MADIFYHGVWRMDWGLGNPNKTAAIIAEIMILVWWLAYWRKWGFWAAVGIFTALGVCLIHTFSRGGVVALTTGLLALTLATRRSWAWKRCLAIGVAITTMVIVACGIGASDRYGQGIASPDRSIANRLMLWNAAPAMMVDAPDGWGIGNSGTAFMRWYQSTEHIERYRTLVNSHLTWLVEFGWPLRFLYILSWFVVFLLCMPSNSDRWRVIPLAIWITFGVASVFSSVAESIWIWGIPLLSLGVVLGHRVLTQRWPKRISWLWPLAITVMLCLGIVIVGGRTDIYKRGGQIIVGTGTPTVWVVIDERPLGQYGYARAVRNYLDEYPSTQSTVGFVESLSCLPANLRGQKVVVSGRPDGTNGASIHRVMSLAAKVVLLAPSYYPSDVGLDRHAVGDTEVIFGEFSQSRYMTTWSDVVDVRRIPGVGDYYPNWPKLIFSKSEHSTAEGATDTH